MSYAIGLEGRMIEFQKSQETPKAFTLAEVRERFGTFIVQSANCILHEQYRGQGDRVLINTTSKGIRGPEGSAFIDLALTKEDAKRIYEQLAEIFEPEISEDEAKKLYEALKRRVEGEDTK